MVTTIQVSETTKQLLEILKERVKARTYDETIRKLVRKETAVPKSMFGAVKGLKQWGEKDDKFKFREL